MNTIGYAKRMDLLAIRSAPILEQSDASNQNHFEPYFVGISASAEEADGTRDCLVQWVAPEFPKNGNWPLPQRQGWQVGTRVLMVRHQHDLVDSTI